MARSIAHSPQLILIDEPTSALNRELAIKALVQLKKMRETSNAPTTIIMITHDRQLAYDFSDVIVQMGPDGNAGYIKDVITQTPPTIEEILLEEEKRKQKEAQYGSQKVNAPSVQQKTGVQNNVHNNVHNKRPGKVVQKPGHPSAGQKVNNLAKPPKKPNPLESQEIPSATLPPAPEMSPPPQLPPAPRISPAFSDNQDADN